MCLQMNEKPRHYPEDTYACLVLGIPPANAHNEAVPIDLLRSLLYVVKETRDHIRLSDHKKAHASVEIFGAIPHLLARRDPEVRAERIGDWSDWPTTRRDNISPRVLKSVIQENPNPDQTVCTLKRIEEQRKALIEAIGDECGLGNYMSVRTLTDILASTEEWTCFINAFEVARSKLNKWLVLGRHNSDEGEKIKFNQALIGLIPDWIKKGLPKDDPEEAELIIDSLLNYSLAELLWIMRKVIKDVVLFHYPREHRYLDLARAYLKQVHRTEDVIARYVVMPEEVDGLKLPVVPSSDKIKPKTLRNTPSEPYRCADPERKIRLYPPDSVEEMKRKLSGNGRFDEAIRDDYMRKMIVPILKLVRDLSGRQTNIRKKLTKQLPSHTLEDLESDLYKNGDRIVKLFFELVIGPLNEAIGKRLEDVTITGA